MTVTREYYNEHVLEKCDEIFRDLWEQGAADRCRNDEEAYGRLQRAYAIAKGENKGVSNAWDHVMAALCSGEDFDRRVNLLYEAALSQASAAMGLAVLARIIYEQKTLYPGSAGKTPMEALIDDENVQEDTPCT